MIPAFIPAFAIEGGLPLALARAFSVIGLVAAFGGLLYPAWVAPAALPDATARALRRCGWTGLALAAAGGVVWLIVQTRDFASDTAPADIADVLLHTRFGQFLATRLSFVGGAAIAFAFRRERLASVFAGVALALQAGAGHAMAMDGLGIKATISALHLLAAGAWLGELIPLLLVVAWAPDAVAAAAVRRFSPFGIGCVLVLLGTSIVQAMSLIGSVPALLGTAYGWVVVSKAMLFLGLVGLAAANRFRHTKRLDEARGLLVRNIAAEFGLGLAVLCAAGVLTELPPSMHVQAIWPFAWVPSLAAWREDADYRIEAVRAGVAVAAGLIFLGLAAHCYRRRRMVLAWPAACLGVALAGFAMPHFGPLLVPATPTMFFHSPTGFAASSIVRGMALFGRNCVSCHGTGGRGDGVLAKRLAVPPADLGAQHLWMHTDGELFGWLQRGIEGPDGGLAMPGFPQLSGDERWALIDFLHANNAGMTVHEGSWGTPVLAPDFPVDCGVAAGPPPMPSTLSDLRGGVVRVVMGSADPVPGLTTVVVAANALVQPGRCIADPAAVLSAYAVVAGRTEAALVQDGGTDFLIDAAGWLRQVGPANRWAGPGEIGKAAAAIAAGPPPAPAPASAMPPGMKM